MGKFKHFMNNVLLKGFIALLVGFLLATNPLVGDFIGGKPEMMMAGTSTRALAHMAMDSCRPLWFFDRNRDNCIAYLTTIGEEAVNDNLLNNYKSHFSQRGVAGPYGH